MKRSTLLAALTVAGATLVGSIAEGDRKGKGGGDYRPLGDDASWTTVHTNTLGLEGLTADSKGNLYTPERGGGADCPVVRVPSSGGTAVTVGTLPAPCSPAGLAFDRRGDLYVADSGKIMRLRPSASSPPVATQFAADVPGSNGVAFDRWGDLWVSDGSTGEGRVWRIRGSGGAPVEMFRVQPMVNAAGVGRNAVSLPPGNPQAIVANGLAFDRDGSLFVGDTARGAIWRVEVGRHGDVRSKVGCDTTFTSNTLCLSNVFVQHPALEGVDGIALDRAGNIVSAANERNAVVAATQRSGIVELFRNPVSSAGLRNAGPLEFPTSPVIVGRRLCVANSDGGRRDNFPNTAGEVAPDTAAVAKLSCLDDRLPAEGLSLPVR
jgi:sugar lactone lactonase YvrE